MGNFNAFGDRYLCLSWENDFFDNCLLQKQNQYWLPDILGTTFSIFRVSILYRALLTGFTGSIQGDILFTKNINARFRVITGTNSKTFVPESCQERPIVFEKKYMALCLK